MANQFRVRKGLIVNGSGSTLLDVQGSQGQLFSITDSLSGSLFAAKDISGIPVIEAFSDNRVNIGTFNAEAIKVSGSFAFVTGSLRGTASWAENSRTASLATTASFAVTASYFSGSISNALLADTASFVTASNVFGPFGSNSVLSSSYALTASFALNAGGAVSAFPFTGSAEITGSLTVTGSVRSTLGFSGSLFGTASWAQNSVTASFVTLAQSASYVQNAQSASYVLQAVSASFATTASYALSSSFATTSSFAQRSISASFATTASYGINIVISGSVNNADYVQFNTASSVTDAVGRLYYDSGEGTIKIGLAGGNVVANIGEDLYQYVYNATGAPLTKGQVVYISGSQGNRIAVKLASAVAEQGSANTIGFVAEAIGTGAEGWVITEGVLRKLNTVGLTAGQLLFLSTTPGAYTQTEPEAPYHGVRLGYPERIDATVGSIYVKIDNGWELGEIHDVIDTTTTSSYGDLLVKSGSVWQNSKQLTGSYGLTGSLTATSFTGSLQGTASWANNAVTASHALTASSADAFTVRNFLELAPGTDPGTANVSASYFFVTSSSDNTEQNLHYRNNGALWEMHWLEQVTNTGLVWGGILTFTASLTDTPPNRTEMRITPGAGLIINHNANTGSHGDTIPTYVEFGPITASAEFITTSQVTYLLIDENGQLIQQTTKFTPEQYVEKFPLGYIFCLTTSSISSYADARVTTYGQVEQEGEFVRAFGPLKLSGYDITAQSGSLKISIAAGQSYRYGGFYTQNPQSPSIYDSTAVPTGSLVRVYRDPSVTGGFRAQTNAGLPFTDIDPTKWDDGSGTLQTVGASEWTIQRLFEGVVNNVTYVYYGQNVYSSLALALQSITTDEFVESPTSILALPFIGYIIAKGDATNLADTTNNRIIQAGLFRNTAGSSGGGGAAAQNLNDLADVNIAGATNGQALIYNSGLWVNGDPANATNASTASYVLQAVSSSFATTASYVQLAETASYVLQAVSSSFASNAATASYVLQAVSASFAFTASFVSLAQTASYVQQAQSASYVLQAVSASFASTASFVTLAQTASFVTAAQTASYVLNAVSSSFSTNAATASYVVLAQTASFVTQAQTASYVLNAVSSSFASTASFVTTAQTASFVTLAQTASFVTLAQSASYVLQAVSSSFASTASFVALAQTASYVLNAQTASYVQQAQSASYVLQAVSASFASTASFVALAQTASYVVTAQTASYVQLAQSASYVLQAVSASFATNASTASYVQLAQTASYVLQAVSSSFASTASFVTLAQTASFVTASNVYGPYGASSVLSSSFAVSASWAPGGSAGLVTKAGSVANSSFAGNPRKATVTFGTAFSNTSYAITVTGEDARTWTIESKAVGSFVINANSNTNLSGTTYWIATAYGETT